MEVWACSFTYVAPSTTCWEMKFVLSPHWQETSKNSTSGFRKFGRWYRINVPSRLFDRTVQLSNMLKSIHNNTTANKVQNSLAAGSMFIFKAICSFETKEGSDFAWKHFLQLTSFNHLRWTAQLIQLLELVFPHHLFAYIVVQECSFLKSDGLPNEGRGIPPLLLQRSWPNSKTCHKGSEDFIYRVVEGNLWQPGRIVSFIF